MVGHDLDERDVRVRVARDRRCRLVPRARAMVGAVEERAPVPLVRPAGSSRRDARAFCPGGVTRSAVVFAYGGLDGSQFVRIEEIGARLGSNSLSGLIRVARAWLFAGRMVPLPHSRLDGRQHVSVAQAARADDARGVVWRARDLRPVGATPPETDGRPKIVAGKVAERLAARDPRDERVEERPVALAGRPVRARWPDERRRAPGTAEPEGPDAMLWHAVVGGVEAREVDLVAGAGEAPDRRLHDRPVRSVVEAWHVRDERALRSQLAHELDGHLQAVALVLDALPLACTAPWGAVVRRDTVSDVALVPLDGEVVDRAIERHGGHGLYGDPRSPPVDLPTPRTTDRRTPTHPPRRKTVDGPSEDR